MATQHGKDTDLGATLGERLRYLRYVHNCSKIALARCSGVPQPTIGQLERGKRHGACVTIATVGKLARAFGLTVSELLEESRPATAALLQTGDAER